MDSLLVHPKRAPHLGIQRNTNRNNTNTVAERVKGAGHPSYSLMGAGFDGLNGTGIEVASLQYKPYMLLTLLYGLEALVLERHELEVLSTYHRRNEPALRSHCNTSTISTDRNTTIGGSC